jgi:hypothetical protein
MHTHTHPHPHLHPHSHKQNELDDNYITTMAICLHGGAAINTLSLFNRFIEA